MALLFILLTTERRAELGISRATGLQRHHLILSLLIEGIGYDLVASLLGLLAGIGAIALELAVLSHLPLSQGVHFPLLLSISWQSLLRAFGLSLFTTLVVVLFTAGWISRMNIVAAMRDLDDPPSAHTRLSRQVAVLWSRPRDESGVPLPETTGHRLSRHVAAIGALLRGLLLSDPLCLLIGLLLPYAE